MISGKPKQALKDPELDPHENRSTVSLLRVEHKSFFQGEEFAAVRSLSDVVEMT
jgi:hypothetical protein